MLDGFDFEYEERGDGLEVIRWLGDPRLEGWSRLDLWGHPAPDFLNANLMWQQMGLLYPALLGLVWRLTNGLARFALPVFDGITRSEAQNLPYELVSWEYRIDWEQPDWRHRDSGFVPAQSLRHIPGSAGILPPQRFPGAALVPVSTWAQLMSIVPIGDQANTTCLFAIHPDTDARAGLVTKLTGPDSPRLRTLLSTDDDLFAVITQEDEGLDLSSLLIAGRGRLKRTFGPESKLLQDRLRTYLSDTADARTPDEWAAAADRLLDV